MALLLDYWIGSCYRAHVKGFLHQLSDGAQSRIKQVYLDHNATTPLHESLKPQILEWLNEWGNPSSIHWQGRRPKAILREARQIMAEFFSSHPLEIVFTSSGSEANNMAIKGVFDQLKTTSRNHYICSSVEHPSVLKTMEYLASCGARVDFVSVSSSGELDIDQYRDLLSEKTALVSIMFANNETGHIFPVKKLTKMAHEVGALYHCDGVQALGKVPIQPPHLGVDLCSFSGHKFYALKGCGVLYIKKGTPLTSLIHGGVQERRRRAGTENLLSVASLGAIVTHEGPYILDRSQKVQTMRDFLQKELMENASGIHIIGSETKRLPNTLAFILEGIDGEALLMNLDMRGFSLSTGAACSSGNPEPSPVLLAMGFPPHRAQSSLRVSLGWGNTLDELKGFLKALLEVIQRLRSLNEPT